VCVHTHILYTHTHTSHTHKHTSTHTYTHKQVAYPDPDLNPRAFAKYGAVKDSCVLAFRREIEMMALVGNHYAEKMQKRKKK
jgi:hypothetical protein